jgi:hypothetical protein
MDTKMLIFMGKGDGKNTTIGYVGMLITRASMIIITLIRDDTGSPDNTSQVLTPI